VSKVEVGRYADLLRKLLSMKGVVDVAPELSPEVSPVFIMEADRPEWQFLKNEKLMSAVFAVTGVVAQNSAVRLRNPAGSGVVATIEHIILSGNMALELFYERNTIQAALATVLPTVARDTRFPQLNASSLLSSQGNNIASSGEAWWSARAPAEAAVVTDIAMVVTPGHQIQLNTVTSNVSIRGTITWRERRLDELER